jgi:hypothetical protein
MGDGVSRRILEHMVCDGGYCKMSSTMGLDFLQSDLTRFASPHMTLYTTRPWRPCHTPETT